MLRPQLKELLDRVNVMREQDLYTLGVEVTSPCGDVVVVGGRECINFNSNNYMGFSLHPKVLEACKAALDEYGLGMGGSPLGCGTTKLHNQLGRRVADLYGKEDCIIFAAGYLALAGTVSGLLGEDDLLIVDSLAHRCIIDGGALSGAKVRSFVHNNMEDLAEVLDATKGRYGARMVAVDSVYSMDGDIANLPELSRICHEHHAWLLIDEAHSLGVLGEKGAGLVNHFGMKNDAAELVAGTFSKFAGACGGFSTGSRELVDVMRHASSPFVFSATLPPPTVAGVLAAMDLVVDEPQWLEQLWRNVRLMLDGLKSKGFDTGTSETFVIPVIIRDPIKTIHFNRKLLDHGIYCQAVVHPAVPPKQSRLRLGVMARHTPEQIEKAVDAFATIGKELGVGG